MCQTISYNALGFKHQMQQVWLTNFPHVLTHVLQVVNNSLHEIGKMSCLLLAELFQTCFPGLVSEVNLIGKLPRHVGRSSKERREYKQNVEEERKWTIARVYHDVI